jgi:hypothetical protein
VERDDERRAIEDVLGGLEIHPLPPNWSPLEGIVLVKCLDEEGGPSWAFRTTAGINDEELLGALTVRIEILKRELLMDYSAEGPDDED